MKKFGGNVTPRCTTEEYVEALFIGFENLELLMNLDHVVSQVQNGDRGPSCT